ncbi:MAG TPA: FdhF/YdeP family oxidoreductase [Chthoniobacteraceae bacterium]|nr:FdhF/YdeP family oxidoreductase [Chthoniobacteraceae bacterium]
MSSHAVPHRRTLSGWVPFGLGQVKPQHFRDMAKIVWENRDNLGYAWDVISKGVCDGCALGVAGLHDWTVKGPHLCMTRLNLLRLNTMPELDYRILADAQGMRMLNNQQLRKLGRLPYPMLRERGQNGFRRISWDDALDRIAGRIRASDPKRVAFFVTSRGVTNEVYYMAQKAARFIGTNHVDNAARLCHSPSGAAMKATLGVAATTCSYKDWYAADLVIFFGSNPANDQPVSTKYLHEAKKCGMKVVLVNPLLEPGMKRYWVPSNIDSAIFGTNIADYWFPVTQGGDIAFLYATLKVLIERGAVDEEFLREKTVGWDALRAEVAKLDAETLSANAGLPWSAAEQFATLLQDAKRAVLVWSMGITQHPWGADGVQMILNLALTQGWVGRDGCGVMPIRGHSSVQGGAEMGAYSTALPGGLPITPENCAALSEQYGFSVPEWRGLTAVEMVEACARRELDVFYCLGGNFLRTLPEPDYVAKAMAGVPLRVHQDIILTDQMFIAGEGDVILLPAKTRYEQDDGGTETSTERRVMFSPELPRQVGEARAEWKILRDLAARVYPEKANLLGCEDGWKMREEIAQVVPFYEGVQRLRTTGDAFQYGGPHLCAGGVFPTADGKAHLSAVNLPETRRQGLFHVSTRRGKQFNTLIYAEIDPLTGAARDAIFMNGEDAGERHLKQGDRIALVNDLGRYEGRVFLADIAPGNLQVMWPEGNVIIRRGVVDRGGGVPDYNALVRIEEAAAEDARHFGVRGNSAALEAR